MKKLLFLALVIFSANSFNSFAKVYIWTKGVKGEFTLTLFSSDSKKVYANSTIGTFVYESQTGISIDYYPEINKMGSIIAESDDGSYIINKNLEKYDNKTKELVWKCPIRDSKDFGLLLKTTSVNGKYLIQIYYKQDSSKSPDNTNIDIYDSETQAKVRSIYNGGGMSGYGFAISNDGKVILQCSAEKINNTYTYTFYIFNALNGKIISKLYETKGFDEDRIGMFSAKNNYCIIRHGTAIVAIDLNTLQISKYYRGGNRICSISNDEKYLILGAANSGSGLEVLVLDGSMMNLETKKSIPIGEDSTMWGVPEDYAFMSNDNKFIIVGCLSAILCYDFENILSVKPTNQEESISISPNPTKNMLIVKNPNNIIIKNSTAYNVAGQAFLLQTVNNEINVSQLTKGTYFLKLTLENNVVLDFNFIKE